MRGDPGFEGLVLAALLQVGLVEGAEEVELLALGGGGEVAVAEVADDLVGVDRLVVDVRALEDAGQEAVAPELGADDRLAGAEDDVAGEVLVLGAQAVE